MTHTSEQKLINIHHYGIDPDNRELYLHSHIMDSEEESGVDYRCAINFEKNLRYLNLISSDPILVHMHMPGGDWSDCLGIYDAILQSHSPIACLAYAKAESASGIIFQAADLRILMPNSYVLIHYGSLSLDGEHKAAMSNIKWNEQEANKMVEIFALKSAESPMAKEKGWKKSVMKKHIVSQLSNKSDWILTPEEAVYYGFADGILGEAPFQTVDHIKRKLSKLT
jgi:ATP-dependent protease ClpP protease subunit